MCYIYIYQILTFSNRRPKLNIHDLPMKLFIFDLTSLADEMLL